MAWVMAVGVSGKVKCFGNIESNGVWPKEINPIDFQ
jgi:hypothetical protein